MKKLIYLSLVFIMVGCKQKDWFGDESKNRCYYYHKIADSVKLFEDKQVTYYSNDTLYLVDSLTISKENFPIYYEGIDSAK
jgi:hypothetical protein